MIGREGRDFAPRSAGAIHDHPEEQRGALLQGNGTRIQDGVKVPVRVGDFRRTPGGMEQGFIAGAGGACVLNVFAPPGEACRKAGAGFSTE